MGKAQLADEIQGHRGQGQTPDRHDDFAVDDVTKTPVGRHRTEEFPRRQQLDKAEDHFDGGEPAS